MLQPRINQIPMKYALQIAEIPEFETEYYEDEDGNKYPIDVRPTGKTEVVYSEPVPFLGTIDDSGGEAEATMYGLSVSEYSAVMTLVKGAIPVKEGMLIWVNSEPQLKHIEVEIDDTVLNGDYAVRESADFYVVKNPIALNIQRIPLQAINK